ncbi:hypothetical protein ACFQJC_02795 [Haloferax namakaokahaiae]|uniref:Twin-arginine translocation signal domain-containing protein n=1 Tax=Haloferax namakaokahaiae TaxID=1748331 RepID=A0ABD5ZB51_9EURY
MDSLTRRRLLHLGSVALMGGVAGCSSAAEPPHPTLGELDVVNFDSTSYTVHVLLFRAGDVVYWASEPVEPATDHTLGGARFDGYPTESIDELVVRRDDQPKPEWERFDLTEYETDCLGFSIHIGDVDRRNPGEVSIWKTTNPRECE